MIFIIFVLSELKRLYIYGLKGHGFHQQETLIDAALDLPNEQLQSKTVILALKINFKAIKSFKNAQ